MDLLTVQILFLIMAYSFGYASGAAISYRASKTRTYNRIKLKALRDGISGTGSISGNVFLSSGSIYGEYGEKPAYTYYREEGKGWKLESVLAEDVLVVEESDAAYLLESDEGHISEIHVPPKSIGKNIKLDMGAA